MRSTLKAQLGQSLNLTPQLLQSIRLLQLDSLQLELEIARSLEQNPMLEVEPDANEAEPELAADDYEASTDAALASGGKDGDDFFDRTAARDLRGVRQKIIDDLRLEIDDERTLLVAEWLVDQVDDNGYLERPLDVLRGEAALQFRCSPERFDALRQRLLAGDPAGYAAVDLSECLAAQLLALEGRVPGRALALKIVREHLAAFATDRESLKQTLDLDDEQLLEVAVLIRSLEPKPAARLAVEEHGTVVPDVLVTRGGDGWRVALNGRTAPKLRVVASAEAALGRAQDAAGAQKLRDLLQEARWFTRGLAMRYDTLLRTARAIVAHQEAFLERGDEYMNAMVLRDVAQAIGMHESTVSRITTGKYAQTPRGTLELKHFFSSKLDGAGVANTAVRAMVKRLIDAENPRSPLADDTIVTLLARQGVKIARRTVAKYRDILHIAPAKQRMRAAVAALAL